MDNVANNGTFMTHLEHVLLRHGFIFVATEWRIWYSISIIYPSSIYLQDVWPDVLHTLLILHAKM